jgi:hypothetical protein
MSRPMDDEAFKALMVIQNDFIKPLNDLKKHIENIEAKLYQSGKDKEDLYAIIRDQKLTIAGYQTEEDL